MMQLELSYKTKYIATTTDCMLQLILTHEKTKKADSTSRQSFKFKQKLNTHQNEENDTNASTKQARGIKNTLKTAELKQIKQNVENKSLHGKYPLTQIKETHIIGYVVQI